MYGIFKLAILYGIEILKLYGYCTENVFWLTYGYCTENVFCLINVDHVIQTKKGNFVVYQKLKLIVMQVSEKGNFHINRLIPAGISLS